MHLPPVKRELNTNTIIQLVTFAILLGGLVWTTAQRDADLSDLTTDFTNYRTAVSASDGRVDQRIAALETGVRRIEQLEYRVTVQEQGAANLSRSVEELKATVNNQSADIRVMLEILKRLDPTVSAR